MRREGEGHHPDHLSLLLPVPSSRDRGSKVGVGVKRTYHQPWSRTPLFSHLEVYRTGEHRGAPTSKVFSGQKLRAGGGGQLQLGIPMVTTGLRQAPCPRGLATGQQPAARPAAPGHLSGPARHTRPGPGRPSAAPSSPQDARLTWENAGGRERCGGVRVPRGGAWQGREARRANFSGSVPSGAAARTKPGPPGLRPPRGGRSPG